jgi:hypothetical protein
MSRVRTIFSHGKFMEVISADPAPCTARKRKDGFAMVPLDWAADVASASNASSFMIFVLLPYLAWKAKSSTFVLSNDYLKRYGVSRETKRRTLARLEKVGVIRVQRQGFHAPIVTLLMSPQTDV